MANLNKVFLMGRLTRDPELRYTASQTAVTELSMAINRSYTTREGETREETVFIDVTVWDRQAETCCQYLKKGRSLHVEGSLRLDSWDDKTTGEKRSKLKIQAERVQFLDRREDGGASGSGTAGVGAGGYEENPQPARERDSAPRRSTPTPSPAPEPQSAGNSPSRGFPAANPNGDAAPRRPPTTPEPSGDDDEDIPF